MTNTWRQLTAENTLLTMMSPYWILVMTDQWSQTIPVGSHSFSHKTESRTDMYSETPLPPGQHFALQGEKINLFGKTLQKCYKSTLDEEKPLKYNNEYWIIHRFQYPDTEKTLSSWNAECCVLEYLRTLSTTTSLCTRVRCGRRNLIWSSVITMLSILCIICGVQIFKISSNFLKISQ